MAQNKPPHLSLSASITLSVTGTVNLLITGQNGGNMKLLPLVPNALVGRKHRLSSDPPAYLHGDGVRNPAQDVKMRLFRNVVAAFKLAEAAGAADSVAPSQIPFASRKVRISPRPKGNEQKQSRMMYLRVGVPHALFIPDSPVREPSRHWFYVQFPRTYRLPRWALKQRKRPVPSVTMW